MRERYSTKFAKITLIGMEMEPEDYIIDRLKRGWPAMKMWHELWHVAKKNRLPMVTDRNLYEWILKVKQEYKVTNGNELVAAEEKK